jgi:endogenous inhibitor of DNA gyrase (YacG/DUF329 family)
MSKVKVKCEHCGKLFVKEKKEYNRKLKNGTKFYCSQSCASTDSQVTTSEIMRKCLFCKKEFISTTHKKHRMCCSIKCAKKYSYNYVDPKNISTALMKRTEKSCPICGKVFNSKSRHCSRRCGSISRGDRTDLYRNYRRECQFNFSLSTYPSEFDFSLIEKYGWYKARNHGNNLNGVSRDHIIYIRHPANCQLLRHNDNVSKGKKRSISFEELKLKIESWNKKYNFENVT